MIITCIMALPIAYTDDEGVKRTVVTRPGSHDYPMLNHKDPAVAEQLRVYRKHSRIGFDELLETDLPILAKMPKNEKQKAKKLLKEVTLKPSPVGRLVKGKKKVASVKTSTTTKATTTTTAK
jgi:hypothetical protein